MNNLQQTIFLNDATNCIADRMHEADVIGLFSKLEGLPNAICEGMTLSKPIIMSKVSDYKYLIDELNGIFCEWDDIESILYSIRYMLNLSNEELNASGNSSKRKAIELFEERKIITRWVEII